MWEQVQGRDDEMVKKLIVTITDTKWKFKDLDDGPRPSLHVQD